MCGGAFSDLGLNPSAKGTLETYSRSRNSKLYRKVNNPPPPPPPSVGIETFWDAHEIHMYANEHVCVCDII